MKKVLTLWQPWASLVVLGIKKVETRSWKTHYRGPLLIHSSQKLAPESQQLMNDPAFAQYSNMMMGKMPMGKIIGQVNLEICETTSKYKNACKHFGRNEELEREALLGDLSEGRFAWSLRSPVAFAEPVPAKGNRMIWSFRQCSKCGCSDADPCMHETAGNCFWVAPDLCSHCDEGLTMIKRAFKTFVQ